MANSKRLLTCIVAWVVVGNRGGCLNREGVVSCIARNKLYADRVAASSLKGRHLDGRIGEFKVVVVVMEQQYVHINGPGCGRSDVFDRDGQAR